MSKSIYALILLLILHIGSARAEVPWVTADQVRARILAAGGETPQAGVDVVLGSGWHSYWRAAGDAGLPPRFDWSNSKNLKTATVLWPAPQRFDEAGLTVFGYADHVTFPVVLEAMDPSQPVALDLTLGIMVCKDICIPEELHLTGSWPAAEGEGESAKRMIDLAARHVPAKENTAPLKFENVVLGPEAIAVTITSQADITKMDVFAVIEESAITTKPEISSLREGSALIKIPKPAGIDDLPAHLKGKTLNLTLVAGKNAIEQDFSF